MPPGASAVYVTVECDNGACATSERMHSTHSPQWTADDVLGGALVLPCADATCVTLHVMAEYGGDHYRYATQRVASVGGTTVALPERAGRARRHLELMAPLDISVELGWTVERVEAPVHGYVTPVQAGSWRVMA